VGKPSSSRPPTTYCKKETYFDQPSNHPSWIRPCQRGRILHSPRTKLRGLRAPIKLSHLLTPTWKPRETLIFCMPATRGVSALDPTACHPEIAFRCAVQVMSSMNDEQQRGKRCQPMQGVTLRTPRIDDGQRRNANGACLPECKINRLIEPERALQGPVCTKRFLSEF